MARQASGTVPQPERWIWQAWAKGPANKNRTQRELPLMRSIIFLVLGVPIPIILLVAMCTHHF